MTPDLTRWALAAATALSVLAVEAAGGQQPAGRQRPTFRGGVDVVSLGVTVTDREQRFVTDLGRGDFIVLEDGLPQDVTFFGRTDVPLALALLLDSSASMTRSLPIAQEAAIGFARQMADTDLTAVVDFDSRVTVLQPFTGDVGAVKDAIRRSRSGGSTALYNAVYIALKELNKVGTGQAEVRRRGLVVLSDGQDTSSLVSLEEVLDLAARSDTVIYTIGLGSERSDGRKWDQSQYVLRQLAQQTGGRAFFPSEARELEAVYRDIRDELAHQYWLAYESQNPRGGHWRRITVRVQREGASVRTRQGYFAARRASP
jgi:Ca-activated chloride channel family protein